MVAKKVNWPLGAVCLISFIRQPPTLSRLSAKEKKQRTLVNIFYLSHFIRGLFRCVVLFFSFYVKVRSQCLNLQSTRV